MSPEAPPPAITMRNVTIRLPDGRVLVDKVSIDIEAGEFVLLAGPSGSGKSTLLREIAGFIDPDDPVHIEVEGTITVDPPVNGTGIVFQTLALFDEMNAQKNVEFALAHGGSGATMKTEANQRLEALGVNPLTPLRQLSGGELQRVALARTLAMERPILLFDEPTTGLDPMRSHEIADRIAALHRESGRTIVVVTHDFAPFMRHAPRCLLIDPSERSLRDVTREDMTSYFDHTTTTVEPPGLDGPRSALRWARLFEEPGRVAAMVGAAAVWPFLGWRQAKWKLFYLWLYLRMTLIGTTAIYVAIAGLMLGFVSIFFSFSEIPHAAVTLPLMSDEMLGGAGSSAFRVLVPLLTAALIAGKCGAAISADIGARRLTRQFEAMRSFGAHPRAYFYGNIVLALAVAAPTLALIAYATNCYASLVAFLMTSPETTVRGFLRHYFARSWPPQRTLPYGTGWFFIKMVGSGILIAALSFGIGARPKSSSIDVSRDVGRTIFWTSLAVLAWHTALAFIEYRD